MLGINAIASSFMFKKILSFPVSNLLISNKSYCTSLSKSYYTVLGLKPNATEDEIKKAYYALSKKYHPDLNINNKSAESKILEINEAFEVLGSKTEKEKYDNKMFPKVWEKNSFIYDQCEETETPKYTYRRVNKNMSVTPIQYYKHVKGEEKRKRRHGVQKTLFNKSQSSVKFSKIQFKY